MYDAKLTKERVSATEPSNLLLQDFCARPITEAMRWLCMVTLFQRQWGDRRSVSFSAVKIFDTASALWLNVNVILKDCE